MSKNSTRVVSFVMALVFFLSTVAISLGVVVAIRQDNKRKQEEKSLLDAAKNANQSADNQSTTEASNMDPNRQMLAGTKLQGYEPAGSVDAVKVIDLVEGNGDEVVTSSTVTAHYTGALASDGTIFQSSLDSGSPFTTQLSGVIAGWQEGMPGMKAGGKRRLIIPAAKAYGANPPAGSGIPANADLVFDIELIAVKN